MEEITPVMAWMGLVGFFLPVICAFAKRLKLTETQRDMLIFAICLLAGFGQAHFNGSLKWANSDPMSLLGIYVINIYLTVSGAFTFYKMFWKPSGLDDRIAGKNKIIKG